MNPVEYQIMAEVEAEHWWYCGLRDLIVRALRRHHRATSQPTAVLDAGCGTGENLRLLRNILAPAYAAGFDISSYALEYAKQKNPDADLYLADICSPVLRVDSLDVILSCDVIYVPGVQAALNGLRQLISALRPGGIFILNVPAYQWLHSRHDVAVHTSQRFTGGDIRRLFQELQLVPELMTYRLCFLFPAVVMARLPSMLRPPADRASARSDVSLPGRTVNGLLRTVLTAENAAIDAGCRMPWGSSFFAVGRKL